MLISENILEELVLQDSNCSLLERDYVRIVNSSGLHSVTSLTTHVISVSCLYINCANSREIQLSVTVVSSSQVLGEVTIFLAMRMGWCLLLSDT